MGIRCEDVLSLKSFAQIELVAGKKGLSRMVTWPHVGQTEQVSEWVHGGELLFITGVIHRSEQLQDVLRECIVKRLSGLVILVGNAYITEIPETLIEQADQAGFPLFRMPWQIKLIDVTKEIIDLIMHDKFALKKGKSFLGRLLFSSDADYGDIVELSTMYEIDLHPYYFIAVFNLPCRTEFSANLEDDFEHTLRSLLKEKRLSSVTLVFGNSVICLVSTETKEGIVDAVAYLKNAYPLLTQIHQNLEVYLGFGRIYTNLAYMKKSYQEAMKSLEICKKSQRNGHVVTYEEMGIYRLLFEIDNIEEIRSFYLYHLGGLIAHDQKHEAHLLATLRQYLYGNCSLVKTAQALFIHRNTLVYRLNQIREILGKEIDDAVVKLDLFNSLIAKEYLGE